jgi:hypothetical protein
MIILITQYYNVTSSDENYRMKRQEEVDWCLRKNLMNSMIDRIDLLVEKEYDVSMFPNNDKIQQFVIGKRLSYLDAFTHYNDKLLGHIAILANADIYMDNSVEILHHINFDINIMLCCNRYECSAVNDSNYCPPMLHGLEENFTVDGVIPFLKAYQPSIWSQDAWIWRCDVMPPNLLLSKYDFNLGTVGCDNYITRLLAEDFIIINPSKLIAVNHYDNLSIREDIYGIRKGAVSSKNTKRIGVTRDYIYLDNIEDIPDIYTNIIENYISVENQQYVEMCDTTIYSARLEKSTEKISFRSEQVLFSSMSNMKINFNSIQLNGNEYWSPQTTDTYPFIQFQFDNIEMIPYIDIQGKRTNKMDRIEGYVTHFMIHYSDTSGVVTCYDEMLPCIDINNSDYIKRIYFKQPIHCNILRLTVKKYHNIPAVRFAVYRMKQNIGEREMEEIVVNPSMIQYNEKLPNTIQYNFDSMYHLCKIVSKNNVITYLEYSQGLDKFKKYYSFNYINPLLCSRLILHGKNLDPNNIILYCVKESYPNVFEKLLIKPSLVQMVYTTYPNYYNYSIIDREITNINKMTTVSEIRKYYFSDLSIQAKYGNYQNYLQYLINCGHFATQKLQSANMLGEEIKEGISVFICIMNRTYNIVNNIHSWLRQSIDELIILDWSSNEEIYDILQEYQDNNTSVTIRYIRVEGETTYIRTFAQNLAIKLCRYNKICKLDSDVLLCNNFFESHLLKKGIFYVGEWQCARNDNEKYLHGNIYLYREDVMYVAGYNEVIRNYGWEDSDLTIRLLLSGLRKRCFNMNMLYHTPHTNGLRLINMNEKINPNVLIEFNKMFISSLPLWNKQYSAQQYDVIESSNTKVVVRRNIEKDVNIINIYNETMLRSLDIYVRKVFTWYMDNDNMEHKTAFKNNDTNYMKQYINNMMDETEIFDFIILSNCKKKNNIDINDIFTVDISGNIQLKIILYDIIVTQVQNTMFKKPTNMIEKFDLLFYIINNTNIRYNNLYCEDMVISNHNMDEKLVIQKYNKFFFKKRLIFQYVFDLMDDIFYNKDPNDRLDKKVYNDNMIVYSYDMMWQEPFKTEKQVYHNIINNKHPMIETIYYLAFPWATLIDDIYKYSKSKLLFIKNYTFDQPITTVCQHIHFRTLLPLFQKIGVKTLYCSHMEEDDHILEEKYGIKMYPFSLYPVKYNITGDIDIYKTDFMYTYSFEGAYDKSIYRTNIREKIGKLQKNNNYINIMNEFYYNGIVYRNKTIESTCMNNNDMYIELIRNSKYTLAPSGTGINSIRFYEAMSYGSVPILLADNMTMMPIDWDQYIVRIPENELYNIDMILEREEPKYYMRRKNCIELFNRMFHPNSMHSIILNKNQTISQFNSKYLVNSYIVMKENMKNINIVYGNKKIEDIEKETIQHNENESSKTILFLKEKITQINGLEKIDSNEYYAFYYEMSDIENCWLYNAWIYILQKNNFNLNNVYLINRDKDIRSFIQ